MSETIVEEKKKLISPLRDSVVVVKPIPKRNGLLYDNTGRTSLPGSKSGFKGVPIDPTTKKYVEPLSKDEREWFESSESNSNFGKGALLANDPINKKTFWTNYSIVLTESDILTLRLSDEGDFLRYAFLKAQLEDIAPSWEERTNKPLSYTHALVDTSVMEQERASNTEKKGEAYRYFGKIDTSVPKMKAFLSTYLRKTKAQIKVPISVKREWLVAEIGKVIEVDVNNFLLVANDKLINVKLFIEECIEGRVIIKTGKNKYQLMGMDEEYGINELAEELNDIKNQAMYAKLKAQLDSK